MQRPSADIYRAGGDDEDDIMSEMTTQNEEEDQDIDGEIEVLEEDSEQTEEDEFGGNGDENLIEASWRDSKPQIGVVSHFSNNMLIKERNAGKMNELDRQV